MVELKTRDIDKAYPSDVIELSAQAVALSAAKGEAVHAHGYVLVQHTDGRARQVHRVDLLTEQQVTSLAIRDPAASRLLRRRVQWLQVRESLSQQSLIGGM